MDIFAPAPPVDFLLPFLRLPKLHLCLGMTTSDGPMLYSEDLTAREFTIHGSPNFYATDSGVPYMDCGGSTDYLSIADASWNSMTGTFTILALAQRDLTQAGAIISKLGAGGNTSWAMYYSGTDRVLGKVTATGADVDAISHYADLGSTVAAWELLTFRYVPSTRIRMGKNAGFGENTTSIPASVFNGTSDLNIGRHPNDTQYLDGRIAMVAICGAYLSDAHISLLVSHCRRCGV